MRRERERERERECVCVCVRDETCKMELCGCRDSDVSLFGRG